MCCDLEIFYQVVKAVDFLPRESVLNSRELAFGRGIKSMFCENNICVPISVYVYVLTSRPYMDLCSWSQEKKKSKRNKAAPLKMLPQMACPSMWIRAAEHTLCSRVLHAGHPALQWPCAAWLSLLLMDLPLSLMVLRLLLLQCPKPLLLAANQAGWHYCCFSVATMLPSLWVAAASCHHDSAPSVSHLAALWWARFG